MGRALRLTYAGALHHVTVRCNNKEFLFDEDSFRMFYNLLRETSQRFEAPLFNYCLMTNHVHLLFAVPSAKSGLYSITRTQALSPLRLRPVRVSFFDSRISTRKFRKEGAGRVRPVCNLHAVEEPRRFRG